MKFARSKRILSLLCAMLMISVVFQNVLGSTQVDTDYDEYLFGGGLHKVWREEVNGTYQLFYANNIGDNNTGIGQGGFLVTSSPVNISYPQVAIDPVSLIGYVLWIIEGPLGEEFWYSGSKDFENWTDARFGGFKPETDGNPSLDLEANNYTLYVTWKDGGSLTVFPDFDGDFIPDNEDNLPFTYNCDRGLMLPDSFNIDEEIGISVAIDYEGNLTQKPMIEPVLLDNPLVGSITPYANVTITLIDNYSVFIKFKYDYSSLPSYVNEKYLRLYAFEEEWHIIGYPSRGEISGVNFEEKYVWALTNQLSIITVADASATDMNQDGIPDIWDQEAGLPVEPERITIFSGESECPKVYITPMDVFHMTWIDSRAGESRIFYKNSDDYGETWSPDEPITDNRVNIQQLVFDGDEDALSVAWVEGNLLYVMYSSDGGSTWTNPYFVSIGDYPSIDVEDNEIYLVYRHWQFGFPDVYMSMKLIWTTGSMDLINANEYNLGNPAGGSLSGVPEIAVKGTQIHVVIADYTYQEEPFMYYFNSPNLGIDWSPGSFLTEYYGVITHGQMDLKANQDDLFLVWSDNRTGQYDIYYKQYVGGGWSDDFRLTYTNSDSKNPDISIYSNNLIHMIWQEDDLNSEIYYMQFTKFPSVIQCEDSTGMDWINEGGLVSGSSDDTYISDDIYQSISESNNLKDHVFEEWEKVGYAEPRQMFTYPLTASAYWGSEKIVVMGHYPGGCGGYKRIWKINVPPGNSHTLRIAGWESTYIKTGLDFSCDFGNLFTLSSGGMDTYEFPLPDNFSGVLTITANTYDPGFWYIALLEVVTEVDYDLLEHTWLFSLPSELPLTKNTFNLETYCDLGGEDLFTFSYSIDDSIYINMFTFNSLTEQGLSFDFPPSVGSYIYIRVVDTDRTPGIIDPATVHIDKMFISGDALPNEIIQVGPEILSEDDNIESKYPSITLDSYGNYYAFWQDLRNRNWEIDTETDLTPFEPPVDIIIDNLFGIPDEDFITFSNDTSEQEILVGIIRNTLQEKFDALTYMMAAGDYEGASVLLENDITPSVYSRISSESTLGDFMTTLGVIGENILPYGNIPYPPANIYVIDTGNGGELKISWNPPSNGPEVTAYKLYRTNIWDYWYYERYDMYQKIEDHLYHSQSPYFDTGLTDGITYYYVVTAFNAEGESDYTNGAFSYDTPTSQPPSVVSKLPSPGSKNVPLNANIEILFSRDMVQSTVNSRFSLTYNDAGVEIPVSCTPSWLSPKRVSFEPGTLQEGKRYTATLLSGSEAMNGMTIATDTIWSFTSFALFPHVTGSTPSGNDADTAADIIIEFSEEMNTGTVESAFSITPSITYITPISWTGNQVMTVIPTTPLDEFTLYEIRIESTAEDLDGFYLNDGASPYLDQFTTGLHKPTFKVAVTSNEFVLNMNWESSTTFDYYEVYWKEDSKPSWILHGTTTSIEYIIDTNYKKDILYNFKIIGYNTVSEIVESDEINVEIGKTEYVLNMNGPEDMTREYGFMEYGLFIHPDGNLGPFDGWSRVKTSGERKYRSNPPTDEGVPEQAFVLNLDYPTPELHKDYILTITYRASSMEEYVLQYGSSGWEPIGQLDFANRNWVTRSVITRHENYVDYSSSSMWPGMNLIFRFSDNIDIDKIEVTPISYYVDVNDADYSVSDEHSPGVILHQNDWGPWDSSNGRFGQFIPVSNSPRMLINIPKFSSNYAITLDYKIEGGIEGHLKQLSWNVLGGTTEYVSLDQPLLADGEWHKSVLHTKLNSDYIYYDASSESFFGLLLHFDVDIFLKGVEIAEDNDLDGMSDYWEISYFNSITSSDGTEDWDCDNFIDLDEYLYKTIPTQPDTDSDGMNDGWEHIFLDPLNWNDNTLDHEQDGMTDLEESLFVFSGGTNAYGTDPWSGDSDSDGLTDLEEYYYGTDPWDGDEDPDRDGLSNTEEKSLSSDPINQMDLFVEIDYDPSLQGVITPALLQPITDFFLTKDVLIHFDIDDSLPYGMSTMTTDQALAIEESYHDNKNTHTYLYYVDAYFQYWDTQENTWVIDTLTGGGTWHTYGSLVFLKGINYLINHEGLSHPFNDCLVAVAFHEIAHSIGVIKYYLGEENYNCDVVPPEPDCVMQLLKDWSGEGYTICDSHWNTFEDRQTKYITYPEYPYAMSLKASVRGEGFETRPWWYP